MKPEITQSVKYIGVNDTDIDLFESQYIVPNGMAYNSYIILDEKIAVMDTVDLRKSGEWLNNLEIILNGACPEYLVVHHLEPDHSGSIEAFCEKYPNAKIVLSVMASRMLEQFCSAKNEKIAVKEGDELSLGNHTLKFIGASMVHWPEVILSYEEEEKILFSADAFGKFGTIDADEDWLCEARRYYFNIVGKYGQQVQALLKKASTLEINCICPLHGPILKGNEIANCVNVYNTWSSYKPESEGTFIAFASIHGNTKKAAEYLKECLEELGEKVAFSEIPREDSAECVEDAFRYGKMVLLASSYDAGLFPPMEEFLIHLRDKTYRNRKIALVQNGSWAPSAAKVMKSYLDNMNGIEYMGETITIKTSLTEKNKEELKALAEAVKNA